MTSPTAVTLPWKPHAKQRPQFNRTTGTAYTPKETKAAEKAILQAWKDEVEERGIERHDGPIKVTIILRNDEFALAIEPCDDYENRKVKGDIDNYAKTILDALNEHAWVDDKQIVDLRMVKE